MRTPKRGRQTSRGIVFCGLTDGQLYECWLDEQRDGGGGGVLPETSRGRGDRGG